jgi:hypothetical protein
MNGMTDDGAAFEPGVAEATAPFRPRVAYVGYRAFGSADGTVLVDPKITRQLRSAAELAAAERRIAGGLLYGRSWNDDQGPYLVIEGYLEAGPGENKDDRIRGDGTDDFTLSEADLRLLREDAARMYTAYLEAGWWRTRAALGGFGPQDFAMQARLAGPGGVGLLVYGAGAHWGTAYLGPDGHAPDSAGTLAATEPVAEQQAEEELILEPGAALAPGPELVDITAGESLLGEPLPGDAAAGTLPQATPPVAAPTAPPPRVRIRRRVTRPVPATPRRWPARPAYPGPKTPADVQFVVWALIAVSIAVVVIIVILVTR